MYGHLKLFLKYIIEPLLVLILLSDKHHLDCETNVANKVREAYIYQFNTDMQRAWC